MKDSSWFSNVLIIVLFSAIGMAGIVLINGTSKNTVEVNEETEISNRVYLSDEGTTDKVSKIAINIESSLEEITNGKIVIEFDKNNVMLNDIYMQDSFIGLNQQVDSASGIAIIDFRTSEESTLTGSFKIAELYFTKTSQEPFRVTLLDETNLNSSEAKVVLNSLEIK